MPIETGMYSSIPLPRAPKSPNEIQSENLALEGQRQDVEHNKQTLDIQRRTQELAQKKQAIAEAEEQSEQVGQLAMSVRTPDDYARATPLARQRGLGPEDWPDLYNPDAVRFNIEQYKNTKNGIEQAKLKLGQDEQVLARDKFEEEKRRGPAITNPNEEALALRAAQGDPEAGEALRLLREQQAGQAASLQSETIRGPKGEPVLAGYNPKLNKYYDQQGSEIPNAQPYVKPDDKTESGLTPTAESNIINRLSSQWGTATAQVNDLNRQAQLMELGLSEARNGNTAAGAQAVLVTFQKILDPTSVVRESEYARSGSGQSLLNQIEGAMEKLVKGGAGVPVKELEGFANLARKAVQNAAGADNLKSIKERIGKTADRYNIPRELVITDVAPAAASATSTTTQAAPKGQWSKGRWAKANPGQNADEAAFEAKKAGYEVIP